MFNFKKLAAAVALFAVAGASQATVISGNLNANGYALLNFNFTGNTQVDFNFTTGDFDPLFSLFDHNGVHVITAEDSESSVFPHLTQVLTSGNYTLAVGASGASWMENAGFAWSDGFNNGVFWVGGTAGLEAYTAGHDSPSDFANAGYALDFESISLDDQGNQGRDVPEPGSLALFGASAAALAWARRRQRRA